MSKQEGICPECESSNTTFIERNEVDGHDYEDIYRCEDCLCTFTENFKAVYQDYTIIQNGNN